MTDRPNKLHINRYSLAAEELALSYALIHHPDLSQEVMNSVANKLTADQVDSRLTAASHSLLARGLCSVSPGSEPELHDEFKQALLSLIEFDYVLQLSIVRSGLQSAATIHVNKGKEFTAHVIQKGVVHLIEHAKSSELREYLFGLFEGFAANASGKVNNIPSLTPGFLGEALKLDTNQIIQKLNLMGWNNSEAQYLAEDLKEQTIRATLIKAPGNKQDSSAKAGSPSISSVLLLMGKKRSWSFEFPSTSDDSPGTVRVIDHEGFKKILSEITN
jgi:hypothetical protein